MAKQKLDGVVEAVRYTRDGQIEWVRAFLRRGPTWSDHVLLDRQALIDQLNAGKRFAVGRRLPQLAGTFETTSSIIAVLINGGTILVTDDLQSDQDCLKDVPLV
jgi:hypothetical protein